MLRQLRDPEEPVELLLAHVFVFTLEVQKASMAERPTPGRQRTALEATRLQTAAMTEMAFRDSCQGFRSSSEDTYVP